MPRITKGRLIALTKFESMGLVGARRMSIEERTGTKLGPYVPPKIYLYVERGGLNRFVGIDLRTREECHFEFRSHKWYRYDPNRPTLTIDFWGWYDLVPLPEKEARKLLKEQLEDRAQKALAAQLERANYWRFRRIILQKAA